MLNFYNRLPARARRVLNYFHFWRRSAVEDDIQPIVIPQSLRRLVLIGRQRHFADTRAAFDFDEADFDAGLRVFRMRLARDQVEAAILGLDAFDLPASGLFVGDDGLDRRAFDLFIAH